MKGIVHVHAHICTASHVHGKTIKFYGETKKFHSGEKNCACAPACVHGESMKFHGAKKNYMWPKFACARLRRG